jgi:molybdopterin/thiamine biosynthesis adenylyltransferase/rhodanese-related sulfurtransferase
MEQSGTASLSNDEKRRYNRHILMPEIGEAGQLKLKESSVLVIGCGGLGSPVLLYLAAAGVGRIGLAEFDTVDDSNLQRQILFSENALGKSKIDEAENRLKAFNRFIQIEKFPGKLSAENAVQIFSKFDVIVDGSDNFPTRYLVNDACELTGKPFVYGAVHRFEGQVSVFNYKGGPVYRDLFPEPPTLEMAPNCATAGVLGVMPGLIGTLQATEVIKILTQTGNILSGKLLLVDALSTNFRKITIRKNQQRRPVDKLIDYEAFCGDNVVESISFARFLEIKPQISQLIDVREIHEFEAENLGGELMPFSELESFVPKIKKDGIVVIHCQSGIRSKRAIQLLQEKYGFVNLVNLDGGIESSRLL